MNRVMRSFNIIFSVLLIATAIGVAVIALPVFGNQSLIVRSGSMAPAIKTGSIVVIRPAASLPSPILNTPLYSVGDVIAFKGRDPKIITTHRVVGIEEQNGQVMYQTKGDANEDPDTTLVPQRNVLGRSWMSLPSLGKALAFAKSDVGLPLLIILPAALVILVEAFNLFREIRKERRRRGETQIIRYKLTQTTSKPNWVGLRVLIPAVLFAVSVPSSLAYLSDTESSVGNTITAWTTSTTTTPTTIPGGGEQLPQPPQGIANHLVISEIQINGANANQDFVEIYNPTNSAVDISNWRLRVRNSAGSESSLVEFPASSSIPAKGYFLWANSQNGYAGSIGANVSNTNNVSPNNSLALFPPSPSTIPVDQVAWGSPSTPFIEGSAFTLAIVSGGSMERKALSTSITATMVSPGIDTLKGNGYDIDNNSNDFVLRAVSEPQNSSSSTESP